MESNNDSNTIWISPDNDGSKYGTYNAPFTDITSTVNRASPGTTIILKAGNYNNPVTIQNSGTICQPIRIIKEKGEGKEVICSSSWYFYEVSDIIISGLTFKDSQYQALSIIGECKRNNFNNLRFVNCGLDTRSLCTFFFAGPGAESNVVENCLFEINPSHIPHNKNDLPIGLLISDGDSDDKTLQNKNHILRNNNFLNYGCAMVLGTKKSCSNKYYSHVVHNNYINNCTSDGIRVNCGDIVIKQNIIKQCRKNGISITKGKTNVISENRIEECNVSINIESHDCSIINNCIIRSGCYALTISTQSQKGIDRTSSILIENNSFIDSGRKNLPYQCEDILFNTEAYCIFKDNLFYRVEKTNLLKIIPVGKKISDIVNFVNNLTTYSYGKKKGCIQRNIEFYNIEKENYTHNSPFGASGWVVEGKKINIDKPNDIDPLNHTNNISPFYKFSDISNYNEEKQMYLRSFFINAETASDESEEKSNFEQYEDDDITDFSTWD